LPIVVMIRPRSGDFLYTRTEFAAMLRDVAHLRRAGANGIVAGVLTAAGELDAARMRELIDAAHPLPVTCHRAFDLCADAMAALDALIALGIARVLTSGQAAAAPAGAAAIRSFVQHARSRLVVMAGAGVRDSNVRELVGATGVQEVLLSATAWTDSAMTFRRPGVPMGSSAPMEEYACRTTDGAAIGRVIANLRRPSA
jgi:copper homeostasis protein